MRISTGMIFEAGVNVMNRQTATLLHLQQQVSSGRRILTPSDDPVSAARALEVTQSQNVVAQFQENHNNANSALGLEEAQLSSSSDLLARVRELAVQAGNSHLASSDRKAIAFELRARFDELTGIANATDGSGQYVFSGFMGSTKPFGGTVEDILTGSGEIGYSGDDGQRKLQVSPTRFLEVSDSGNDVFKRIRNGNGYFVTNYGVNAGVSTNTGTAIIDGGSVTDPSKWNASDYTNIQVQFFVDTPVQDGPSTTYYDIIDTDPLSPTFNRSMLTGNVATAPPSPPAAFPGGLRLFTSNQPIQLSSAAGDWATFDLGSSVTISGDPANADSFSITPSSTQSIFATIANLIGSLESANTGAAGGTAKLANDIGFALTNLDQGTENILRIRAQIGSRMGEIDSLSNVNEDLNLQYQQTLSQLQDLDYAKAITDMQRKQLDLQAAQQSFAQVSKLSLFNYL